MSFLTEIRDYAYKAKNTVCEWVGIKKAENDNNTRKVTKTNNQTAIITQKNPGRNEDEFVRVHTGKKSKEQSVLTQGKTFGSVENLFKERCNACGADFSKIKMMLNGKNRAFDNLSEVKKVQKYEAIIAALELAKQMKAEGRFNQKTDINAWAITSANLQAEVQNIQLSALFAQHLATTKDFDKQLKNAKSNEEVLNLAKNKNIEISKSYANEIEKVKNSDKLTKEEKQKAIAQLNKERRILLKDLILSVTASTGDNDKLYHAIRVVDSKDAGVAVRMMRETRIDKKAKTEFSDNITFGKMKAMAASYAEQKGQEFTKTGIRDFNTEITIGMSAHALNDYQKSYVNTRTAHENGTSQSPELDGLFSSIAEGIGTGATLNTNFASNEEKLQFLSKWEDDARQFSDYEEVMAGRKAAVQEYIEKYGASDPELIKHVEEIEQRFEKLVEQKETERSESKTSEKADKQTNSTEHKPKETVTTAKIQSTETTAATNVKNSATIVNHSSNNTLGNKMYATQNTFEKSNNDSYVSTPATSTEIINTILKKGYNAAPEGKRLILVLTNPLLSKIAESNQQVEQDIRNISDAEYFRPAMFGKAKIRQRILNNANPNIQDDLYAMVEGKVGNDFDIINKDKYSKDNEKERKLG